MTTPISTNDNFIKGIKYRFKAFALSDFSNIESVSQVWGLIINSDNKLLIVSSNNSSWCLPGGKPEKNESSIETLNREIYEESAIILDQNSIEPFYLQEVHRLEQDKEIFESNQIRYIAKVKKIENFRSDPVGDHGIKHQKFIDIRDLKKYINWGELTSWIIKNLDTK